jgi:hypothetical protein
MKYPEQALFSVRWSFLDVLPADGHIFQKLRIVKIA